MPSSSPDPAPRDPQSGLIRSRQRRARIVGWVVSVVLHLAVILLYSGVAGPPTVRVSPTGEGSPELRGMEVLNLIARADAELERPEEPEQETERLPVPVAPAEEPGATDREATEVDPTRDPEEIPGPLGPDAAERLRVQLQDERLWEPLDEEVMRVSAERFLESELAWRLGLWQDSVAMAEARAASATDWTWTDEDGNRWGVSPGKLHLGSVTLPLPFSFGTNPGRFYEAQERAFVDGEIARGAQTYLIRESWRDRAQAIRQRRDRERAEARESEGGAGPRRIRPDTTGVPRIR